MPECEECGCDPCECEDDDDYEEDDSLFDADELGLDPEEHDLARRGWRYA